MDGTSFSVDDFRVTDIDGNELPIARVDWFDADDSGTGQSVRNNAFLVLDDPLGAGALVSFEVTGKVADGAGNTIGPTDEIPADDGIAPTATVSLGGTLTTEEVVITIATDEAIRTLEPELSLFVATTDDPDTADTFNARTIGVNIPRAVRTPGENVWTFTLNIATSNKYSVVVAAEDASRNRGETGVELWPGNDDAITFEIDNALHSPTGVLPDDGSTVGFQNPFVVEIDWSSEGGEYVGDSHDQVQLMKAVLDEGTANELDVLPSATTPNGYLWEFLIPDITLGAHTFSFNGEDVLGNTLAEDGVLTFTVESPSVIGSVRLQGRADHSGATVVLDSGDPIPYTTETSADGSFAVTAPPGVYTITVEKDGHLTARRENQEVVADQVLELPELTLLGGDFDGDGVVGIRDVVLSASNLDKDASPW